jgi:hypothetical protein
MLTIFAFVVKTFRKSLIYRGPGFIAYDISSILFIYIGRKVLKEFKYMGMEGRYSLGGARILQGVYDGF